MSLFSQVFGQNNAFDYKAAWDKVKAAEEKGLPETALKTVNQVYTQAKTDGNDGQLIKALIYKIKYAEEKNDNVLASNIGEIKSELDKIPDTRIGAKALLHSILGEMYWRYYQQNRWKFRNRTNTVNLQQDDMETWSLEKIIDETIEQYTLSCGLRQANIQTALQATGYEPFTPVLNKGNKKGRQERPTLYDFLAHRALSFFKSEEPDVTKPAFAFTLNQEEFLADAQVFSKQKIETKDTLATKYYALRLLQELTELHLNDKEPIALIVIDLERLGFVYDYATFPNKTTLFIKAAEELEKKYISSPSSTHVTFEIASKYFALGNQYNPAKGEANKWDKKKAFELCETAKKRFPDSDGAIECENLQNQILSKTVSAQLEEVNLPDKPFRALVKYTNFTNLNWRALKITRNEVAEIRKKWARNYNVDQEEEFLKYFLAKTPFKAGKAILPTEGDYQQHSAEVKIDDLPVGEYMILFSNKTDFTLKDNGLGYAYTTISNISFVNRNTVDGGTDVRLLHRETGKPLAQVKAQLIYYKYNYQTSEYLTKKGAAFTSDAEGYFKIPLQKTDDDYRQNFSIQFTLGNDHLNSENIENSYGDFSQYVIQKRTADYVTFFFLDRAIYRPGQTIYFKGLVTSTDGKTSSIVAKHSVNVSLKDANHQESANQQFTTNEYGTFNGTFTAPSSGLLGEMQLETSDETGQIAFSVEEYKRPKFEVRFEPVKGTFRLGETIKAEGIAQAYSGANIDGAGVQYRVVRKARFPYWWWCKWGFYPTSPEVEITNGIAKTDAQGKFEVLFTALPDLTIDKSSDPVFNYTVYADVTDINGETHSNETTISVGYKALQLGVGTQSIDLADEKTTAKTWQINTTNLAGQFEPSKGQITIHRLKNPEKAFRKRLWERPDKFIYTPEEFKTTFPLDAYADEDNETKWPLDKEVLNIAFDTEKQKTLTLEKAAQWETGKYVLEITSSDKFGQPVKEIAYFNVYNSKGKTLFIPSVEHFQGLKISAEPGEKAIVSVGSSANIELLYEVEQDGKILQKEWISLRNEQKTLEFPIKEEYRGNIAIHYSFVRDSRVFTRTETIYVPYSNKDLSISFETFRDKLQPGQKEEWRLKIKGKATDKVAAEMVAGMYDASLDVFRANFWSANFWGSNQAQLAWRSEHGFGQSSVRPFVKYWNDQKHRYTENPGFDALDWFGYSFYRYGDSRKMKKGGAMRSANMAGSFEGGEEEKMAEMSAPAPLMEVAMDSALPKADALAQASPGGIPKEQKKEEQISQPRTNFNETAFFYPNLKTNEAGELVIAFTIPESLTRWKMMGFAHTQDLKFGFVQKELVTQKELMVVPNQPRFFREGDKMTFSSKITSLSEQDSQGDATLQFFDALTGKEISADLLAKGVKTAKAFSVKAKQSTTVEWDIAIPESFQAVSYRIMAKAGAFADGEEMILPVVTNRTLVTETLPLPIRGKQTKTFTLDKLKNNKSTTLKSHRYTLEFTSNPAWYAIQALPYLMEYPYECVEQTFSRFYANSIASHVANSNPKIKQVFNTWRNIQPDALLSNLEKNQELKSALLEETPWVLQAKDETQRKRNVALLFDLNRMGNDQERAMEKVKKAQTSSGGFTWFPGMPEDRYMTQHIIAGLGHLDVMGVKSVRENNETWAMTTKALGYLDREMRDDYEKLKAAAKRKELKLEEYSPSSFIIHYLYTRSYFADKKVEEKNKEAFDYFLRQSKKYWLHQNIYLEGMTALAIHRFGEKELTKTMIKSFKERALHSEEMGMYYKQTAGYYWYQAPIETQALLIEVFDEVANDQTAVEDLKVWLLKQKQTQDWKTTKATSEACYALLRRGSNALANTQIPEITVGGTPLAFGADGISNVEAGTGYFKTAWMADQIKPEMGEIKITKKDDGVAWGAVYWQYFEQMDKITPAETPLKLKKQLFLQQNSDRGPVLSPITDQNG